MEKCSLQYLKSDNSGPWSDVSVCNRRTTSHLKKDCLFKYDQILPRKDVAGLGFIVLGILGFHKQFFICILFIFRLTQNSSDHVQV